MLRRLGRFLLHFRWPLMAGVLTLFVLAYVLQPRPMKEYHLPLGTGIADEFMVSPSGRYLVQFYDLSDSKKFHLIDLDTRRVVLEQTYHNKSYCRFDVNDGLAFTTISTPDAPSSQEYLLHYLPAGSDTPQRVASSETEPAAFSTTINAFVLNRHGPVSQDDASRRSNCLLSPDVQTWLTTRQIDDEIEFRLLDVPTGKTRAVLQRKPKELQHHLDAAFSQDGRQLLLQYAVPDAPTPFSKYALELFDTQTGQRTWQKVLPPYVRFKQLVLLEGNHLQAIDNTDRLPSLQRISNQQNYQRSLLKEVIADPLERPYPGEAGSTWVAVTELCSRVDVSNGQFVYCWEHKLYPKHSDFGGGAPELPGFHYALRDLHTGSLIHSGQLPLPKGSETRLDSDRWLLLDILPGQTLLL